MNPAMAVPESMGADEAAPPVTRIYEDGIPDFAEAALESLYECSMTTLLRFRQYYCLDGAATYVAWRAGAISTVIVFQVEGRAIRVYNEQIVIAPDQLLDFARTVYRHYPRVGRISLYAVDVPTGALPFPHQKLRCLEKISMPLPGTPAAYHALLSKNMAARMKYYDRKLQADFACVARQVCGAGAALEATVRRIVGFSRMRMAVKGQPCYHTEEETSKLVELVKRYGFVHALEIDGEVRGGAILLRIGSTHALQTLAHDPDYDRYNLGTLCCYDAVAHAIRSGARHFDFGWGVYDYKYRLLGQHQDLHRIDIYRSRLALARDLPTFCRHRMQAQRRRFKAWMAHPGASEGAAEQVLRRALRALRAARARFH